MTACRPIRLNAFDMACVGHIQHGMWTHPRDHSSDYTSLDHWVSLARMLERGLFDGLFLADVLGAYDVYGGNADASLRGAVQIPAARDLNGAQKEHAVYNVGLSWVPGSR